MAGVFYVGLLLFIVVCKSVINSLLTVITVL